MSADVLKAWSNFARFSAGRRVRFSDLGVPTFVELGSEVAGCFNWNIVATDGLAAFVRINALAKFPSHCPVCWHPIAPRLDASGVGQPRHRLGLNKARKN